MIKAPALTAIHEAELRVFHSSQLVYGGLSRVRGAFHNTFARPLTFLKIAGVAGLFCFWLARRTRSRSPYPVKSFLGSIANSALGLALAFILRYGKRRLRTVFQ